MIGIILDCILMLLLVSALAYGVRLEKKLSALRAGQLAFAGAVHELNTAAGRAESALASLRASGEEADLLHDRIIKARAVKQELEVLVNRAARATPLSAPAQAAAAPEPAYEDTLRRPSPAAIRAPMAARSPAYRDADRGQDRAAAMSDVDDRALRMAALAERIQGTISSPAAGRSPSARDTPSRDVGRDGGRDVGSREPGRDNVSAIMSAMTANHAAQQSLNRARRNLEDDLFAA